MNDSYGKVQSGRYNKIKRRITGAVIIVILIAAAAWAIGILAGNSAEYQERSSILRANHELLEENEALKQQVAELQAQADALQGQVSERDAYIAALPTDEPAAEETLLPEDETAQDMPVDEGNISPRAY